MTVILQALDKKEDVRKWIIRREIAKDGKKTISKAPKIQRLITPVRLQRKRKWAAIKRQRYEASNEAAKQYNAMIAEKLKAKHEKAKEEKKKRATRRSTQDEKKAAAPAKVASPKKH